MGLRTERRLWIMADIERKCMLIRKERKSKRKTRRFDQMIEKQMIDYTNRKREE